MNCIVRVRSDTPLPRARQRAAQGLSYFHVLLFVAPIIGAVAVAGRLITLPSPFDLVVATLAAASMLVLAKLLRDAKAWGQQRLKESVRLADAVPDVLLVMRPDGTLILANARVEDHFGYGVDEVIGTSVEELVPGALEFGRRLLRERRARVPPGFSFDQKNILQAIRKDGAELPVDVGFSSMELGGKTVLICVMRDVTEAQRAREALMCANSDLARGLTAIEERAHAMQLLEQASEYLQCSIKEAEVHRLVSEWANRLAPETMGVLLLLDPARSMAQPVSGWGGEAGRPKSSLAAGIGSEECWALRRGRVHQSRPGMPAGACAHRGAQAAGAAVCIPLLGQGEPLGVMVVEGPDWALEQARTQMLHALADRAAAALANLRLREELRAQTLRDPLTGLYNRRYFDEALDREVSRVVRAGESLALLMIDFDHFKRLNDTYGHPAGDAVLRSVGRLLAHELRATDVAGRIGGEEIAILLPQTDAVSARRVAEHLRMKVRQMQVTHGPVTLAPITISTGIAMAPDDAKEADALLARADEALYRAKREGRNRVVQSGAEPETGAAVRA
jgi:diguanylate cyclase (GGDEF)-like protein/PAS domain S-box-containing protein